MALRAAQHADYQPLEADYQPFEFATGASFFVLRPSFYRRTGKRMLDLALSVPLLLAALPLIAVLVLAIVVSSGWQAFYPSTRLGKNGKHFHMWKLRTMIKDAEILPETWREVNPKIAAVYFQNFKLRDDPRVTRLGRFLRRTSLDELPQLWNVIRGDMSLVAPRPIVPAEIAKYEHCESLLLSQPPGVTGAWQVSGRNDIDYPERSLIDLGYVESLTLRGDLVLLARTIFTLTKINGL